MLLTEGCTLMMVCFLNRNVNHHRFHHHTAQILQIPAGKDSHITETVLVCSDLQVEVPYLKKNIFAVPFLLHVFT